MFFLSRSGLTGSKQRSMVHIVKIVVVKHEWCHVNLDPLFFVLSSILLQLFYASACNLDAFRGTMDPWANDVLMTTRWFCVETSQDVYYVKHYLESTDYCVLVTNLRQVWSDTAHAPDIIAQAHRHFLDIDTNDQVEQLLIELRVLLNDLDRCTFQRDLPHGDRSKDVLKIICKENKGLTSLTWSFECQPVDDASVVLYDHFISPMLCMMSSKGMPSIALFVIQEWNLTLDYLFRG